MPEKVNFKEFAIRFTNTCLNRAQSTYNMPGKFFSVISFSFNPFSLVWMENTSNISITTSRKLTIVSKGLNFPILILNRSIKSLTWKLRSEAELKTTLRNLLQVYFYVLLFSRSVIRFFDRDMIAFKGVLMSWDIVAVNMSASCECSLSFSYLIPLVISLITTIRTSYS